MVPHLISQRTTLLLLTLIIGFALVVNANWMTWNIRLPGFRPFGDDPSWYFGKRELIHLSGLFGCVLFGWPLLHSFSIKNRLKVHAPMLLVALALILLINNGPEAILAWVSPDGLTYTQLLASYVISVPLLLAVQRFKPRLLKARKALTICTVGLVAVSLLWEVVVQPHFPTYGEPPHGYYQWSQILADVAGIMLGYWASRCVFKRITRR